MQRYWDERARENALYFIDNRLAYGSPDESAFWDGAAGDLDMILGRLGASFAPQDVVVEIGCGVGRLTRVIASRAARVRALDVSEEMLSLARRHNAELENVDWLLGDGLSLAGIEDGSTGACFSHVVFQHIPDPKVTLGYVREMGRVLRAGGWAAFQISNDASLHRPIRGLARIRQAALGVFGRAPRGQRDPAWVGSAVELDELGRAADDGGLAIERVVGEGTQFCYVLARCSEAAAD
jgi:SAM-dependent methyltransferase